MDRWMNKIAIVTGVSSGIGRAIAELLVQNGLRVVGLDQQTDKLELLAKEWKSKSGKLIPLQCDLANESEITRSMAWIEKNLGVAELLINNAAVHLGSGLLDTSPEDWTRTMNVNVLGPVLLIQWVLTLWKRKGLNTGVIININDIGAWNVPRCENWPMQTSTGYLASKSALRSLTDNLRWEVAQAQWNVKVVSIVPGLVETEWTEQLLNKSQLAWALKPKDIADTVALVLQTPGNVQIQDLVVTPVRDIHA